MRNVKDSPGGAWLVGVMLLLLATPAARGAEYVWAKQAIQPIREGKGPGSPEVGRATKGGRLEVLAREGNWLRVRGGEGAHAVEGYVFAGSVSTTEVKPDGNALAFIGKPDARQTGAAAGKGLVDATQFARSRNLNPALLQQMIARSQSLPQQELEEFERVGQVGMAKPAK